MDRTCIETWDSTKTPEQQQDALHEHQKINKIQKKQGEKNAAYSHQSLFELKARDESNKIAEFVEYDYQTREPIEDICHYALSKTLMCDNAWRNNTSTEPNMKRRYAHNYDLREERCYHNRISNSNKSNSYSRKSDER